MRCGALTHLTSTSPPMCMRKEPSGCFSACRYSRSFFLRDVGTWGSTELAPTPLRPPRRAMPAPPLYLSMTPNASSVPMMQSALTAA